MKIKTFTTSKIPGYILPAIDRFMCSLNLRTDKFWANTLREELLLKNGS